MQCTESKYSGFSSAGDKPRYKTIAPPSRRSDIPVRKLRRPGGDSGSDTAPADQEESVASEPVSLDGYAYCAVWWLFGWHLSASESGYLTLWLGVTILACLASARYAKYWVVSFLVLYLFKQVLLS